MEKITDSTVLILSSLLAKSIPIVFGFFVVSQYGVSEYSLFVSFVLVANLLLNLSAMGINPLILTSKGSFVEFVKVGVVGLLLLLFALSISLLFYFAFPNSLRFFSSASIVNMLSLFFYVFGMFLVYSSIAFLNGCKNHAGAAKIWFFCFLCLLFAIFSLFVFSSNYQCALLAYAVAPLLAGLYGFSASGLLPKTQLPIVNLITKGELLSISKKAALFCSFGFMQTLVFLFFQNRMSNQDEIAAVSLMIQVYSVAIFIPSALGSFVIPRLSSVENKSHWIFYFIYFCISTFVVSVVCVFLQRMFFYYDVSSTQGIQVAVTFFMASAVFASMQAYSIQRVVVIGDYGLLMMVYFLWAALIIALVYLLNASLLELSVIFCCSQVILFILFVYLLRTRYSYA